MLNRFMTAVVVPAALLVAASPAGATLIGDTLDISVTTVGPGPLATDSGVVAVDPGVEISQGDASNIDTNYFSLDIGGGQTYFDSASIDVQAFDIFVNLDVNDIFAGLGNTVSAIFTFDLVDFQGAWAGLPIGSVGIGSDDPYFATAQGLCTLSNCVDFDSNTIQLEIISNSTSPFTYRLNPAPVPEPGTFLLFGCGLLGVAALRRRKA